MTDISIRSARLEDLQQIKDASRETLADHQRRHPYAFSDRFFDDHFAERFDHAVSSGAGKDRQNDTLFVAEWGGAFAGYILLHPSLSESAKDTWGFEPKEGWITDVFVVPDFRGHGIGDTLIRYAQRKANALDFDNLVAQVWEGNTFSEDLFLRAGFTLQSKSYRSGPVRTAQGMPSQSKWNGLGQTGLQKLAQGLVNCFAIIGALAVLWILLWGTVR